MAGEISNHIAPQVANMLGMKQRGFGVYPTGDGYTDTTPTQVGAFSNSAYAGVDLGGLSANGRISAAMLAGVVVVLLVFHKTTRGLQL